MKSRWLAIVFIVFLLPTNASSDVISFSLSGRWLLTGVDDQYPYTEWTADLYITQLDETGDRRGLLGSFYWNGTGGDVPGEIWGWEDFDDSVISKVCYFDVPTMRFHVEGFQVRDAGSTKSGWGLGISSYDADVSEDGNHLLNGSWGGSNPGVWEAERVLVPEPSMFCLFTCMGMLCAHWTVRRRNMTA